MTKTEATEIIRIMSIRTVRGGKFEVMSGGTFMGTFRNKKDANLYAEAINTATDIGCVVNDYITGETITLF